MTDEHKRSMGETLDELHLFDTEGRSVPPKDVVKPNLRLGSAGFGTPRIYSLRLAFDQPPIVATHMLPLEDGQMGLETTVAGARQILGSHHRASEGFQLLNLQSQTDGILIVVKRDDIREF